MPHCVADGMTAGWRVSSNNRNNNCEGANNHAQHGCALHCIIHSSLHIIRPDCRDICQTHALRDGSRRIVTICNCPPTTHAALHHACPNTAHSIHQCCSAPCLIRPRPSIRPWPNQAAGGQIRSLEKMPNAPWDILKCMDTRAYYLKITSARMACAFSCELYCPPTV